MKVVHVATGSSPVPPVKYDGTAKDIFYLTRALARQGCDVSVIDSKTSSADRKDSRAQFIEVWNPPLSDVSGLKHILRIVTFALLSVRTLRHVMRKEHPDIIHLHSQFPSAAVLLARHFLGRRAPIIHNTHNTLIVMQTSWRNRLKHGLEVFALRHADFVMADTESVKKRIQAVFKVPENIIYVRPEGIDVRQVDEFVKANPPEPRAKSDKTVIYPAVIDPRKNQMGLLKAIPYVLHSHPDTTFVLPGPIGNKPYYEALRSYAEEKGLTNRVQFVGELPLVPDLFRWYQKSDIFVFPTLYETQGVILLEAMAFSLPCAASNIGPIVDIAGTDGSGALLFDANNVEEISRTLVRLLEDDALCQRLSAAGKLIARRFDWDVIAADMVKQYESMSANFERANA